MNPNLTTDRPTFVTHLECSMTGERYDADTLHGLSRVGRPLLVRYDLDAVRANLPKRLLETRPSDLWRWRELLPVRHTRNVVSLGEIETPLVPIPRRFRRSWINTRSLQIPQHLTRTRSAIWSKMPTIPIALHY